MIYHALNRAVARLPLFQKNADEQREDRILEVADFVAGFCSPHMKVWPG
jgi:hypothetical protein